MRGIIMQRPSAYAIYLGTKTQTRRLVSPQPNLPPRANLESEERRYCLGEHERWEPCEWIEVGGPFREGQWLWVRERFQVFEVGTNIPIRYTPRPPCSLAYAATEELRARQTDTPEWKGPWHAPLLMPKWASRFTLRVTKLELQRLRQMTLEDARAEGIPPTYGEAVLQGCAILRWEEKQAKQSDPSCFWEKRTSLENYAVLWDSLHPEKGTQWADDPLVWTISFEVVTAEENLLLDGEP